METNFKNIFSLKESRLHFQSTTVVESSNNTAEVFAVQFNNIQFTKPGGFFPDVTLLSIDSGNLYNPIEEIVMSLRKATPKRDVLSSMKPTVKVECPLFYFIYNTENYYHFLYDTLPYLIIATKLKASIPDLKLLVNYPNPQMQHFFKFFEELTELTGFKKEDWVLMDHSASYSTLFVGCSLTHGPSDNAPPHPLVLPFLRKIKDPPRNATGTAKIYISRRDSVTRDRSNIGTDYTTRRKMENEDELVKLLESFGFTEVFTELLSSEEKIALFQEAEIVVGAIGGGLANVVFSPPSTRLLCIVSPTFLDVNARFLHAFSGVKHRLFMETHHVEPGPLRLYTRVCCVDDGIVGEIISYSNDFVTIAYSDTPIAGWNATTRYKTRQLRRDQCKALDDGLNSPWKVDLGKFEFELENLQKI